MPPQAVDWPPPPESLACADLEVHVWRIPLDPPPEAVERLREELSEAERVRAARFAFEHLRRRHVVAHAAMRGILARYLRLPSASIAYEVGPKGKPALRAGLGDDRLEFNLSHSEDLALLAVTRSGPVGVDVEAVRPLGDRDALVERQFAVEERRQFHALAESARDLAFFLGWTRKEAFVKARGEGLASDLTRFAVNLDPDRPAGFHRIDPSVSSPEGWRLHDLNPAPGFCGALVTSATATVLRQWGWAPEG